MSSIKVIMFCLNVVLLAITFGAVTVGLVELRKYLKSENIIKNKEKK